MNTLIDGHMVGTNEGGNERYTRNLFNYLLKEKGINVKLLVNRKYSKSNKKLENESIFTQRIDSNIYRLSYFIPYLVKANKIDIVHSNYISPLRKNAKQVISVHDVSFKNFPEHFSFRERLIFRFLLPYCLKKADAIIIPSEFSKKEVLRFYPKLREKLFVVNYAADEIFNHIPKIKAKEKIKRVFKLNNPFLLAINGKNPRKNINRVISAYLTLRKKFPDLKLVIVGGNFNIDEKNVNTNGVVILGNVKDEELNLLYNAADLFIYFSVYEGFGLPILEALKCKALVICSDIEVHREIAKNGVVYANRFSEKDLAKKIEFLLKNKSYAEKIKRNSNGINKIYSWGKTAKQTVRIYNLLKK